MKIILSNQNHTMSETLTLINYQLAYDHIEGNGVCVLFCAGFNSNKQGNKALFLESICREQGWEYIRFDYRGHGDSGGDFADACVSDWLSDALAMIDHVAVNQSIILVGSSMGGWIALHAALARHERLKGLLLIACAADMTRYYPQRLEGLSLQNDEAGRPFYSVTNSYDDEQDYRIYQKLLDDGEKLMLLHTDIHLAVPLRLIHGVADDVVPWQRSAEVLEKVLSKDGRLELIKHGDHRLSNPADLERIAENLKELVLLNSRGSVT